MECKFWIRSRAGFDFCKSFASHVADVRFLSRESDKVREAEGQRLIEDFEINLKIYLGLSEELLR